MAEFLGLVEFGTLYKNGMELPLPKKPWTFSAWLEETLKLGRGDIPYYTELKDMSKWVIGNSSKNINNRLKWIKIKDDDKTLLICDRAILCDINWLDLNSQGYVSGKDIIIDGIKCKCRLLTGGKLIGDDEFSKEHTNGEYDKYIVNRDNIQGLPKPSLDDLDNYTLKTFNGASNQLWNWVSIWTICKDEFEAITTEYNKYDESRKVRRSFIPIRGCKKVDEFSANQIREDFRGDGVVWRPVLEVFNEPPIISDIDKNLGDKNGAFSVSYQVNDADNDSLIIVEKLNGNILRTINNAPKGENLTINFTNEQLYSLPLNQENKISIEVNDNKGGISYRNYTFKRTNTPPIINNSDRDLGVINSIQEKYKITDMEGNVVSVVEKLDNSILRTFNVDPDKEYVTTIDKDTWIRLKNGQHKYVIEATDFNNAKTIRTFTFTKKETKISFTLVKPFTTDIKATKILITPSWEITGATAKVEACNNAFDVNPTWEDITKQVLINRHYNFTNTTKTADKWGINIRFTIDKDPTAVNDVCIKGFGGAFE